MFNCPEGRLRRSDGSRSAKKGRRQAGGQVPARIQAGVERRTPHRPGHEERDHYVHPQWRYRSDGTGPAQGGPTGERLGGRRAEAARPGPGSDGTDLAGGLQASSLGVDMRAVRPALRFARRSLLGVCLLRVSSLAPLTATESLESPPLDHPPLPLHYTQEENFFLPGCQGDKTNTPDLFGPGCLFCPS